ncbi:MAG: NAD(P)/FAD-dependent oxidoreductase [Pseudomonadota bacterium]
MAREVVVMGAGIVGVSVAWHLARRGHSVTLVDRREPGRETSFGNAGIIQRESVQPYAFPRDLSTMLRVLPNRQVDIRYRPAGMVGAASPLLQYWINSGGSRYAKIVPEYASLIMRCLDTHGPMVEAAGADHLVQREGWLELYHTRKALDERIATARDNRERFGVEFEVLDPDALYARESYLKKGLVGAIHWTQPWTVTDPGALVQAYAEHFQQLGGRFVQAEVRGVEKRGKAWSVTTDEAVLEAEQLVVAMGPWSSKLLSSLGISVPLFVKRGYHMHYASADESARLNHWVMDAETGFLLEPMRAGIRLTTGAELADLDAPPRFNQLKAAEKAARKIYPLGERCDAEPWKGARPCLPDMKPIIGAAPGQDGLWLALGHGHQGFTLGPVTGLLLSQMMEGETPEVDMAPFRADRF